MVEEPVFKLKMTLEIRPGTWVFLPTVRVA